MIFVRRLLMFKQRSFTTIANINKENNTKMVTLVIATSADQASIGPASALLAMPGWHIGPSSIQGTPSYVNKEVRLLKLDNRLVQEDHLDKRWEEATGETVNDVIFLSKHVASSNRPALTIHPIGMDIMSVVTKRSAKGTPYLRENEVPLAGGRSRWAAPPNPRIGPWFRLLKRIADLNGLTPEFEVTLEATHHGPVIDSPTMFVEIGSTEEYWKRQDAAQAIALLVREGLGLGEAAAVGDWSRNDGKNKVLFGIGGGHYVPRHMDVATKDDAWVGHLLPGYSLLMEDPGQSGNKIISEGVQETWGETIRVAYEATKSAFPGGEVLAHLDHKSFKGWQRHAITRFLAEQNIKIGKSGDF